MRPSPCTATPTASTATSAISPPSIPPRRSPAPGTAAPPGTASTPGRIPRTRTPIRIPIPTIPLISRCSGRPPSAKTPAAAIRPTARAPAILIRTRFPPPSTFAATARGSCCSSTPSTAPRATTSGTTCGAPPASSRARTSCSIGCVRIPWTPGRWAATTLCRTSPASATSSWTIPSWPSSSLASPFPRITPLPPAAPLHPPTP